MFVNMFDIYSISKLFEAGFVNLNAFICLWGRDKFTLRILHKTNYNEFINYHLVLGLYLVLFIGLQLMGLL